MSLKALSQILAAGGISTSQEAYILTSFRSLSTSPQPQENLEVSFEETKESCTTSDGENLVEPEIEDISTCLSENPVCILETNYLDLHGMIGKDIQSGPNEEVAQIHHDYIKHSFQNTIKSRNHSLILLQLFCIKSFEVVGLS